MKRENLAWKLERIYLENYEYDNLVGIYSTLSDLFNTAAKSAIPDVAKRYSTEHKYWSEKAKGLSSRVSMEKLQSDLHKQVEEDLQHKV